MFLAQHRLFTFICISGLLVCAKVPTKGTSEQETRESFLRMDTHKLVCKKQNKKRRITRFRDPEISQMIKLFNFGLAKAERS